MEYIIQKSYKTWNGLYYIVENWALKTYLKTTTDLKNQNFKTKKKHSGNAFLKFCFRKLSWKKKTNC